MDWAMLVVTALATFAAVASAVVAIVQARSAKASEADAVIARNEAREARDESARLASEANAAFIRQAAAQERANALKEEELRPPVWSNPRHISGDLYSMANSSGRTLKVERMDVEPDGTEALIRVRGNEDGVYEVGDSFDFMVMRRLSIRPRKLTLCWRFVDEPASELNKFIVTL
jgi:hypothetical protein